MEKLERLLEDRKNWIEKTGRCLFSMPIIKHEQFRYLPTYYKVLADYERKIAQEYELLEDGTYPVEVKRLPIVEL